MPGRGWRGSAATCWDRDQKRDLGEAVAQAAIDRCLDHFGMAREELPRLLKSDPRKMLIAGLLRYRFPVSAAWLGLRPNIHQIEERVDGQIFISVIAYHLLRWVSHTLEQGGDLREWKTVRRLRCTHSLVTTRLTLEDGRVIRIRKPSLPDAAQQEVYHRLGIDWRAAFKPVKRR